MAIRNPEEFDIQFVSAGDGKDDVYARLGSRKELCPVKFHVSREYQSFDVTVFVDKSLVPPVDYIKVAAHQLALDFERLAAQTAEMKLAEGDVPKVAEPEIQPEFPSRDRERK